MKEFKTLTELQILNMAHTSLLAVWLREKERAEKGGDLAKARFNKVDAQYRELSDEIIRLEREAE